MAIVAPSILSANFSRLVNEVMEVITYGAEFIHIDVMDGHFVPNITMGPVIYKDLRKEVDAVFDVHLMIENPDQYINDFALAGADIITFHYEASKDILKTIDLIKSVGKKVGISIKPNTDVLLLEPYLKYLDLVLVMSVEPGFGGQDFMPSALEKIKYLNKYKNNNNLNYLIEVDGGINQKTGKLCVDAGADVLVAGSFIFNSSDRKNAVKELKEL